MKMTILILSTLIFVSCEAINLESLDEANINSKSVSSPMITTWRVGAAFHGDQDNSITLPLRSGYDYNMAVDWGDGESSEITSYDDVDITHVYDNAGDYTVTIYGLAEAWYFNLSGDSGKLVNVNNLGSLGWKNLEGAFEGCSNLISFSGGDTSGVTNMAKMFRSNGLNDTNYDFSNFDTSNVTDMSNMFQWNYQLTNLDISSFDTSKVETMEGMFYYTEKLVNLNTSNFNTFNVTNMEGMFYYNRALESIDLSHFDTSSVVNMRDMFYYSSALKTINANGWDVSNVTNDINTFYFAGAYIDGIYNSDGVDVICDQSAGDLFGKTCTP